MLLVITLPDLAQFGAETTASWALCDTNGNKLRSGEGVLADAPREANVIVLVPASRVVFIETPLPAVSAAKRDLLVRYAIEDKLTIDPSTVHAVVLESKPAFQSSKPKSLHIAAAIDRAWFSAALAWLAKASLKPRAAFATTALLPVGSGEWSVQLSAKNAFAKRADGFAYAIDVGALAQPPFALTLALSEVSEKPAAISVFVARSSIDAAGDAALAANWQAALGVPVRFRDLENINNAPQLKLLTTLKSGNLLSGEFAPIRLASAWTKSLQPALALLGIITCIQIAAVLADNWQLDRKRQAIETDMRQTFQAAFPRATAIIDPALQMQRNLDTLKRERGMLREDESRRTLARFATLQATIPELDVIEVNIKPGDAKLIAKLNSAAAINVGSVGGNVSSASTASGVDAATVSTLQTRIGAISRATVAAGARPGTIEIAMKVGL